MRDRLYDHLRSALPEDRVGVLEQLLTEIGDDRSLLEQLTPSATEVLNAATGDRKTVRYGSVVVRAPSPGLRSTWQLPRGRVPVDLRAGVPQGGLMSDEPDNPLNGPPRTFDYDVSEPMRESDYGRFPVQYESSKGYGLLIGILVVIAMLVGGCALLLSQLEWTKGRPLRGRGRAKRRSASARAGLGTAEVAALRWRAIAVEEYESIASFSELALDLMAAGAPPDLGRRCHQAAIEEERHTQTCLEIAQGLDGRHSPIPAVPALGTTRRRPRWRTALLVRLAVESYLDGCIGEASSAWVLAQLRRTTDSDEIRTALGTLAREEMGHARLGGDIVRWCCETGGPVVVRAVARAEAGVAKMHAPRTDGGGDLRRFGVPDDELRARAFEWARARAA